MVTLWGNYEGISQCSVHFIPLHKHPVWRDKYNLTPEQFPVAENNFQRIISIPLYTAMTREDQDRVIAAVIEIIK